MARDPKRIRIFLKELGDLWEINPDLRFFQLICYISQQKDLNALFNLEEPEILKRIRELLSR